MTVTLSGVNQLASATTGLPAELTAPAASVTAPFVFVDLPDPVPAV